MASAAISPARAAAFDVVLRVFEDEAYADRALRTAAAGLDARDGALARQLAYGTVQRARTLDHAIEAIGRRPRPPPRSAGARRVATRRVPARIPRRRATVRGRQRVGRAGPARAARARRRVHECRPATPGRRCPDTRRGAARGDLGGRRRRALVSRLGRADLVARTRRGGRPCAHASPERGTGYRRPAHPRRRRG